MRRKQKIAPKEKENKDHLIFSLLKQLFDAIMDMLKQEKVSLPGKVNVISDMFLLLLSIIAMTFGGLWAAISKLIDYLFGKDNNSPNVTTCLLIFAVFAILCLVFMHFTLKEEKKYDDTDE